MTLQPSLIIWTVICFCVLMFILNKLLFKPLLAFMDARKEKVAKARERAEEIMRERSERSAALQAVREAELLAESEKRNKEIEQFKAFAENELKKTESENRAKLEALSEQIGTSDNETYEAIASSMDKMAEAFAERLLSIR